VFLLSLCLDCLNNFRKSLVCAIIRTMRSRGRWFDYILLNIIISAAVTGTVLFLYDRYQRSLVEPVTPPEILQPTPGVPANYGDLKLEIVSVIGTGVAETETVVLQNKGQDSILLTGWVLKNGSGTSYTFPQVKMFKDVIVQVHTSAGVNTPVDLYWGQNQAVWHSGDTASLYDTQGVLRASYLIP
jgi:hypothetical protein